MPKSHPASNWRVLWSNWQGHHDWIGRRLLKKNGVRKAYRIKPPIRHTRDFPTQTAAKEFVAELRRQIPDDELVVQIIPPPGPVWVGLPGKPQLKEDGTVRADSASGKRLYTPTIEIPERLVRDKFTAQALAAVDEMLGPQGAR
jgi:hypothetical protein